MATGPRRAAIAAVAALALGAAACGADSDDAPKPLSPSATSAPARSPSSPSARDWTAGSREERVATVEVIKAAINLEDGTGETPELSDEEAYRVIDTTCAEDFAASFRLYKVYARATGFASFAE